MPGEFPTAFAAATRVPLYPSDAHAWDVHNGAAVSPTMHLLPVAERLEDMVGSLFVDFVKTVDSNYAAMLERAEALRAEFSSEVGSFSASIGERLGVIETVLDGKLSEELDPVFTKWLGGMSFAPANAQPNVIETVKVDGVPLHVFDDKSVDIRSTGMISDSAGNVIRADGSAVVVDGSWTCNGVLLTKKEGRDYWENAENKWGLGYDSSAKWAFTNGSGYARSDAPTDATKLSFVIGEVTYEATIGRADSVVMSGDVVPKGSGTEVIATIGGKDIKAPASQVSSVNGKTGAVKLVAADVGALAPESANKVGSSFSMGFEGEETSGGNILFGVGSGPAGWTFIVNKLYCSDNLFANGFVITNTSGALGESVLARIQEYGGDFKTALAEVNGLIGTAIDATAAYPMSTVVDGALRDRTVNHATAGGTFTFPARTGTNVRDFVLVIDALETAPTVTFPGSVTYVSEQDAADIWTADAGKVNAWYFSEQTDGVFMVCHKAMSVV